MIISSQCQVEAARVMPTKTYDPGNNNHFAAMYPLYESAKHRITDLLGQLDSAGPSTGRGGHWFCVIIGHSLYIIFLVGNKHIDLTQ